MSPRIQRLAMRLLRFRFELTFVPGKNLQVPDTLSRDPTDETIDTTYLETNLKVHSIIAARPENKVRLIEAINEDPVLQKIKFYVLNGWPKHKQCAPVEVKKYWEIKDDIYLHNDVLFYKSRLIIPSRLREEFLTLLHKSHQGVVACKKLAEQSIYYPGWLKDVENVVLSCSVCQSYSRSNQREPLTPHDIPDLPWQKIGIDFMLLARTDFLIVVDYFSKFTVVNKLTSKTAEAVISTLKNIFSTNGLPQEIFSDCGPPFTSHQFESFAKQYDIMLSTSSPYYPRSNGMIERAIQSVKGLLAKCLQDGGDPFLAILSYNTTPKQDLPAPCDILMGRKLRTTLPVSKKLLEPKFSIVGVKETLKLRQDKQKSNYDVHTKVLPELQQNQSVLIQEKPRQWRPGIVVSKSGPNDYVVEAGEAQYRRNRQHIRPLRKSLPVAQPVQERITNETGSGDINQERDQEIIFNRDIDNNSDCVTTRSGRVVRPPDKLIMS
nr:unnamed protein product [Callosobruchus analis]